MFYGALYAKLALSANNHRNQEVTPLSKYIWQINPT